MDEDIRPCADSLARAIRLFSEGARVTVCTKETKTADHCPNKSHRLVCHTEKQAKNFFTGK